MGSAALAGLLRRLQFSGRFRLSDHRPRPQGIVEQRKEVDGPGRRRPRPQSAPATGARTLPDPQRHLQRDGRRHHRHRRHGIDQFRFDRPADPGPRRQLRKRRQAAAGRSPALSSVRPGAENIAVFALRPAADGARGEPERRVRPIQAEISHLRETGRVARPGRGRPARFRKADHSLAMGRHAVRLLLRLAASKTRQDRRPDVQQRISRRRKRPCAPAADRPPRRQARAALLGQAGRPGAAAGPEEPPPVRRLAARPHVERRRTCAAGQPGQPLEIGLRRAARRARRGARGNRFRRPVRTLAPLGAERIFADHEPPRRRSAERADRPAAGADGRRHGARRFRPRRPLRAR